MTADLGGLSSPYGTRSREQLHMRICACTGPMAEDSVAYVYVYSSSNLTVPMTTWRCVCKLGLLGLTMVGLLGLASYCILMRLITGRQIQKMFISNAQAIKLAALTDCLSRCDSHLQRPIAKF